MENSFWERLLTDYGMNDPEDRESKLLRNVGNTSPIITVSFFRRLLHQQTCEKVTTHILKQVPVCDLTSSSLSSKDSHRRESDGREDLGGNNFQTISKQFPNKPLLGHLDRTDSFIAFKRGT